MLLCIGLALAGCSRNETNDASPPQSENYKVNTEQTAPNRIKQQMPANPQEVTERLERLAASVPQVKSANCVVMGNTAVVGIDIEGTADRSRVGTIKYSVAEALRKDPYGVNAIVTADMDLADRIREIREDIANGKPFSGLANEMADIIGRIIPQLPQDVAPEYDPPAMQQQGKNGAVQQPSS
ncbi:YhcN/YlaJ family sporulation lipoprotein [Paenibacillus turpanensis]|uniref:YhcN/YlaJ family sporulation lipoprotein n=1 Tax=Paenibacillus turpanensis TaxID=2689078 RepID=UPI001FB762B4|nr:YhcN/YlaJ family sporulation lipoprotein [Paenibacillus turpanensis]